MNCNFSKPRSNSVCTINATDSGNLKKYSYNINFSAQEQRPVSSLSNYNSNPNFETVRPISSTTTALLQRILTPVITKTSTTTAVKKDQTSNFRSPSISTLSNSNFRQFKNVQIPNYTAPLSPVLSLIRIPTVDLLNEMERRIIIAGYIILLLSAVIITSIYASFLGYILFWNMVGFEDGWPFLCFFVSIGITIIATVFSVCFSSAEGQLTRRFVTQMNLTLCLAVVVAMLSRFDIAVLLDENFLYILRVRAQHEKLQLLVHYMIIWQIELLVLTALLIVVGKSGWYSCKRVTSCCIRRLK